VHPEADDSVVHAVLQWFEETEPGPQLTAWALSVDARTLAVLAERGYVQSDHEWYEHLVYDLDTPPPEPETPVGYDVRPMRGEEELEPRVDVHRAAFAPSRVVPESYRDVMRAWPYRAELDHVAVAPDGSFAAFALGWLDEENRVGELEPVGTHPEHRRLGLATAVCTSTLRALHEAGARTCLVYSIGGSVATGVYTGVGFEQRARHLPFRRGIPH
jgi:ribosomal protein S18 acetylase RimI-like enzyme